MKSKHAVFLALALLSGCAGTSKQLEICYGRADARLVSDSATQCNGQLDGCAEESRLEREHWQRYEACLAEDEDR